MSHVVLELARTCLFVCADLNTDLTQVLFTPDRVVLCKFVTLKTNHLLSLWEPVTHMNGTSINLERSLYFVIAVARKILHKLTGKPCECWKLFTSVITENSQKWPSTSEACYKRENRRRDGLTHLSASLSNGQTINSAIASWSGCNLQTASQAAEATFRDQLSVILQEKHVDLHNFLVCNLRCGCLQDQHPIHFYSLQDKLLQMRCSPIDRATTQRWNCCCYTFVKKMSPQAKLMSRSILHWNPSTHIDYMASNNRLKSRRAATPRQQSGDKTS